MHPIFTLEKVGFVYQDVAALRDVSLTIQRGERVAILGANGSGKSTLLTLLAGLVQCTTGKIIFSGLPLTEKALANPEFAHGFRRQVQLVFQDADWQLFNSTVEEEVAFGPLQLGLPVHEAHSRVHEAIARLGIDQLMQRPPYRLSGGEKKRVALACVLSIDPDILLLDEPTSSLDPRTARRMVQLLGSLTAEKTLILATHDLEQVKLLTQRCLVFDGGALLADGPTQEILANHSMLEQANLI